jgi:hypothetical protein
VKKAIMVAMPYSFWDDPKGRVAVSVNANSPGPVAGYLLRVEHGWSIEGDETKVTFTTREDAAKVVIQRHRAKPN